MSFQCNGAINSRQEKTRKSAFKRVGRFYTDVGFPIDKRDANRLKCQAKRKWIVPKILKGNSPA